MNRFVSQTSNSVKRLKLVETCLYASIGVLNIGQIFFAVTPLHYTHVVLALTGIVFVAMAINLMTPITDLLRYIRKPSDSSVLSLETPSPRKNTGVLIPDDNSRRAA